jgi:DNA-binding transcriptional ArsR family regulator
MIYEKMVELVARRFQVLGEPCRIRILQALQSGPKTVSQIVRDLVGNQPNISKHLQILFSSSAQALSAANVPATVSFTALLIR